MRTHSQPITAAASSGIDLAPMLDFVVNLLVFFIVTAVFIRDPGIALKRQSGADREGVAKSIVIGEDGGISIDDRAVDLRAVRAHIEQYRATNAEGGVVIVAHEHAPKGVLVAVADQAYLGGIDDVVFSTGQ